jgi:hypothetical protein
MHGPSSAAVSLSAITSPLTANAMSHEHQPERQRQRQVAARGLQRDRGGHHPCHVVDVAAHDDHRADLGNGPAEARKQSGEQL